MATKTINTRIKNRFDTLENWTKDGVTLLPGEIALTRVTTTQTDEATGKVVHVPAVLMKVGTNYTEAEAADKGNAALKDTPKPFNELPWLSAKAADVYGWAKTEKAEDVYISIKTSENAEVTRKTLGEWVKITHNTTETNSAAIAAINDTLSGLLGSDSSGGSISTQIATQIVAALSVLDFDDSSAILDEDKNNKKQFVTAITQTDGTISVTKRELQEVDLPDISASKIVVTPAGGETAAVMLDGKLDAIDASISAIEGILGNVSNVASAISTAINALDYVDTSATTSTDTTASGTYFVTKVEQTDGTIAVTKHKLPTASDTDAGIVKLGATGGAATYDSIYGTDGKGGINKQVDENTAAIAAINTAIAGGVHFIGITNTDISSAPSTGTVSLEDGVDDEGDTKYKNHSAIIGDVVIKGEKEFIWDGSKWYELGDLTRTGALETLVDSLSEDNATANSFITHITKNVNGTFTVNKARPEASDVKYSTTTVDGTETTVTVKDAIDDHVAQLSAIDTVLTGVNGKADASGNNYDTVIEAIDAKIAELDFSDPTVPTTGTTTAVEFIDTVSQTDGQITATKKKLPEATTSVKGIVQLSSDLTDTSEADETKAATIKAVYDVKQTADSAAADAASIAANYVRFTKDTNTNTYSMHLGNDSDSDSDIIVFDCGGAE